VKRRLCSAITPGLTPARSGSHRRARRHAGLQTGKARYSDCWHIEPGRWNGPAPSFPHNHQKPAPGGAARRAHLQKPPQSCGTIVQCGRGLPIPRSADATSCSAHPDHQKLAWEQTIGLVKNGPGSPPDLSPNPTRGCRQPAPLHSGSSMPGTEDGTLGPSSGRHRSPSFWDCR